MMCNILPLLMFFVVIVVEDTLILNKLNEPISSVYDKY